MAGTFLDSFLPAITGDLAQIPGAMAQGQLQGMTAAQQLALLDAQIKQQQIQNMQAQRAMQKPQTPTFHSLGGGAFAITDPQGTVTRIERPPQQMQPFRAPVPAQPGQPIYDPNTRQWSTAPGEPVQKPVSPVPFQPGQPFFNPREQTWGQAPGQPIQKPPVPFEPGQPYFNPSTGGWGTAPGQAVVKPSIGQSAVDREFAKDYASFVAGGGYADVDKQLGQLRSAVQSLKTDSSLTGPFVGLVPDAIRNVTNPASIAVRDQVMEVVQRNLRMILGPQFTEREGMLLMKRAYNEQQPPEENIKRMNLLITQIEAAAKAKAEAGRYFEQHGTLQGWKGRLPSLSDFNPEAGAMPTAQAPAPAKPMKQGSAIRFNQLTKQGKTKMEAFQIMKQEGY